MMSKSYFWRMSIWIGIVVGLYCMLYQLLPLPTKNMMWATFVALPIYFGAGAKPQEFPHFFCSMLAGVIWAYIYLGGISWFVKMGIGVPATMFIVVGVVTIVLCAFHLIITPNTWFNKLPMMFGTIATIFSQNGDNLLTIMITLTGGLIVGLLCTVGTNWLTKDLMAEEKKTS